LFTLSSIDILVPCYRYGRYLRECVKSVTSQSVDNLRVLILNDASPDDTDEVAQQLSKEDSRVSYVRHPTNKGHIATYNEGIHWAAADYFLLLSADDYLLPGALERAISLMQHSHDLAFVFGNAIEIDEQNHRTKTDVVPGKCDKIVLRGREFVALSGARNIVPTPTAVVRTALQKKVGGYRTELPHTGDMEMWLRLAAHGAVGFIQSPQAVYRRHSSNMSLGYSASWLPDLKQRQEALKSLFVSGGMFADQRLRARLLRLLSVDAVSCASRAFNAGKMDISGDIRSFAIELHPGVKRSWPWVKLSCKRFVGRRAWQVVRRMKVSAELKPLPRGINSVEEEP
jgi:GT2 family glycosyltransferase